MLLGVIFAVSLYLFNRFLKKQFSFCCDEDGVNNKIVWDLCMTAVHALIIIQFNKIFGRLAKWQVTLENHKYMSDFENSLIIRSYLLAFVNSYTPLFFAAFVDLDYISLNFTLAIILIFKQVILALISNISPSIQFPKKFRKLDMIVDKHILKYGEEYETDH